MKFMTIFFITVVLLDIYIKVACDPITAVVVLGAAIGTYLFANSPRKPTTRQFSQIASQVVDTAKTVLKVGCQKIGYCEGCEDYWITHNIQALERELLNDVFGQPIAIEMVVSSLRSHLDRGIQPSRPLLLSFHGRPGTGKNYISKKIIKNMFRKGKDTEFVQFFRGSIDFPSNKQVETYKSNLMKIINNKIWECNRSVFVFDEVEKMPAGILDVLNGIIKHGQFGEYDYRRAIFILLSNTGSELLYKEALKMHDMSFDREDTDGKYLSKLLATTAFNEDGGLKHSALIKSMAISHYIPFLPLEKQHVIMCLENEIKKINQVISPELVEQVLQDLEFHPEDTQIFAVDGCKNAPEKVHYFIQRQHWRNRGTRMD